MPLTLPTWLQSIPLEYGGKRPKLLNAPYLVHRLQSPGEHRAPYDVDSYGPCGWERIGHGSYVWVAPLFTENQLPWMQGFERPERQREVLAYLKTRTVRLQVVLKPGFYRAICEPEDSSWQWKILFDPRHSDEALDIEPSFSVSADAVLWMPLP